MSSSSLAVQPMRAGLAAARATFVPGLVVQAVILGVVLSYYFLPAARPMLDQVATWKVRGGIFFSSASMMIGGSLFPEVLRVVFLQKGRIQRENWTNLLFTLPVWGLQGVWVDLLYRGQAAWFGDNAQFATVLKKVCFDQFIYNPVLAGPFSITIYEWKNRGYRWSSEFLTWAWYRGRVFPGLIATWCVWLPLVSLIYCLPEVLQVPVACLALTFWVTLFTWMTESLAQKPVPPIM